MSHLGARLSALVDGALEPAQRDRALAHVAGCAACRRDLDAERFVKAAMAASSAPWPTPRLLGTLAGIAAPGIPAPPRAPSTVAGPVVPALPPLGRGPRGLRRDSRGPAYAGSSSGPGSFRRTRRARYAAAGAFSVASLVLGAAFAAGSPSGSGGTVVPPSAELTVEHGTTTSGTTIGDPGLGMAGVGPTANAP